MTKKRTELFGVLSRILVYVIVMSLFESIETIEKRSR